MLEVIGDGSAAIAGQHGLVVCGVNARRACGTTIAVEDSTSRVNACYAMLFNRSSSLVRRA